MGGRRADGIGAGGEQVRGPGGTCGRCWTVERCDLCFCQLDVESSTTRLTHSVHTPVTTHDTRDTQPKRVLATTPLHARRRTMPTQATGARRRRSARCSRRAARCARSAIHKHPLRIAAGAAHKHKHPPCRIASVATRAPTPAATASPPAPLTDGSRDPLALRACPLARSPPLHILTHTHASRMESMCALRGARRTDDQCSAPSVRARERERCHTASKE